MRVGGGRCRGKRWGGGRCRGSREGGRRCSGIKREEEGEQKSIESEDNLSAAPLASFSSSNMFDCS